MIYCADKFQETSSDNPEGLSREELGRLVASRWTGESVNEVSKDDKKGHEDVHEIPEPAEEASEDELEIPEPAEESYGGYHSEVEDDRHKYDDEEFNHESEDEYADEHVESYKSDDDQKGGHHSGRVIQPHYYSCSICHFLILICCFRFNCNRTFLVDGQNSADCTECSPKIQLFQNPCGFIR